MCVTVIVIVDPGANPEPDTDMVSPGCAVDGDTLIVGFRGGGGVAVGGGAVGVLVGEAGGVAVEAGVFVAVGTGCVVGDGAALVLVGCAPGGVLVVPGGATVAVGPPVVGLEVGADGACVLPELAVDPPGPPGLAAPSAFAGGF